MSMIGHLHRISAAKLAAIERKPGSIKNALRKKSYDMQAAINDRLRGKVTQRTLAMEAAYARSQEVRAELLNSERAPGPATLDEMRKIMQPLVEAGAFGQDKNILSLDKSWHVLHYLLCGSETPADSPRGRAIMGARDLGPDLGYGPARSLAPHEVREVSETLRPLRKETLASEWDPERAPLDRLYAYHDAGDVALALDYLDKLQEFYAASAQQGAAILFYVR